MADNIDVTPGTGKTVAADEIAGALHQRVKITVGADGTNDGDVSSANPLPVNDAGGSLTVDNAHLTSLGGAVSGTEVQVDIVASLPEGTNAIGKLSENSGVDIGDVDVTSCALPTGAATAAKQDTIAGHVDGIETLLGTIDADTSTIAGDTTSIDGKITACNTGAVTVAASALPSGASTEATLSTLNGKVTACNTGAVVLAAGTAGIGKLTANSGVDIGDVDVLSLPSLPAGTNNIGDVDVLSLPALAAGTNNIGDVDVVSMASGKTILRAVISAASSGDNTLVAAVADKKIKVLSVCLVATAAVTVRFESGASGTALSGVISLDAKSGFILNAPADPNMHWFETGVNTLLNLELGGAVQVSGMMTYYTEA